MNKRLFVLLVILMSLSLVGIIFVQAYYINNTFKNEEKQFTFKVKKALSYTSTAIEDREYNSYVHKFQEALDNGAQPDTTTINELIAVKRYEGSNEIIVFRNGILEENFKVPSLIDIGLDSINISKIYNRRETIIYRENSLDGTLKISPESFKSITEMTRLQQRAFESHYREQAKYTPIHKRVSKKQVYKMLSYKLKADDIDIDFEYAIYSKDLATKIQSENFELTETPIIGVPLFLDNNDESDFRLYINFPERKEFIFSSIIGITMLSIIFTLIIIIAYAGAIYQLIKQRKISEIKTDFINNMTHEFKTPIATIYLILDAIKNPKVISDKDKVNRYLKMIKEENKRMHAQVENVLRISKLEKKELNISKESINIHDLVTGAIAHVELIIESRKGYVKTHLEATKSTVLVNETYFTNVMVNILDNAVKYSRNAPKIDVYTENIENNILLRIKDQGNGMSKSVQKRVFEKFYREHTGNIHNVKGHGLGLAYVKRIIADHNGEITVESEKGKGSTFIIKLPLIS